MFSGRVNPAIGLVGLLGLASPILASAPAPAQEQPAVTGVAITPSRVEQDITTGSALVRVTVKNSERSNRSVTVSLGGLTHDLAGTPQFDGAPPPGVTIRGDGTFDMAPDEAREVEVEVNLPPGGGGKYLSVLATIPSGTRDGATVRNRVASLVMLRPSQPWNTSLALEDVEIRRRQGDGYAVSAIVRNTGDVHVTPKGRIEMAATGANAGTVSLESETILPGAARRLSGTWTPAGDGAGGSGGGGGGNSGGGAPVNPSTDPVDATVVLTDPDFTGSLRARFVDEVVTDDGATNEGIDGGDGTTEVDLGAGDPDGDDGLGSETAAVVIAALLLALMAAGIAIYSYRRSRQS